jgi:lysophospholipid acyltransferase (LPLAT)-like uncharacterized protein
METCQGPRMCGRLPGIPFAGGHARTGPARSPRSRFVKEFQVPQHTSDKLRWYDPVFLGVLPPLGALLIKLLMLSCRVVRVEGLERARRAAEASAGGAVYVTWHQRMPYHFHHFGSRHVTVMISRSRDGEYAARVARWLGFRDVRGSSSRGGKQALREIIRRMRQGEIGGMLADGPQGPARVAKMGSVIMARDAGVPLIPVLWGADRCWQFNSWDRYLVPKPFARVAILYEEPVIVPPGARGGLLESYRRLLQDRLNRGTRWCDEQFGSERPWKRDPDPNDAEAPGKTG